MGSQVRGQRPAPPLLQGASLGHLPQSRASRLDSLCYLLPIGVNLVCIALVFLGFALNLFQCVQLTLELVRRLSPLPVYGLRGRLKPFGFLVDILNLPGDELAILQVDLYVCLKGLPKRLIELILCFRCTLVEGTKELVDRRYSRVRVDGQVKVQILCHAETKAAFRLP